VAQACDTARYPARCSRKLEDLKQLRDYGIVDGSIAAHVATTEATESVNYPQLASLLQAAHATSLGGRRSDPANFGRGGGGTWDPSWPGGTEWQRLPTVLVGGTGLTRDEVVEAEDEETDDDGAFREWNRGDGGGSVCGF
jgi:hypothetical protein